MRSAARPMRRSGVRTPRSSTPTASVLLMAALLASTGVRAGFDDAWRARVSANLLAIYDAVSRHASAHASRSTGAPSSTAAPSPFVPHIDAGGRVQVDVHYDCASRAPVEALTAAGLSIGATVHVPPLCVLEGWVAPASLASIARVAGVTRVTIPSYPLPPHAPPASPAVPGRPTAPGAPRPARPQVKQQSPTGLAIDGNGISIMHADQFVVQTGSGGAGITVGVQSAGATSLTLIQARGELPKVQVLTPSGQSSPSLGDEGTVLLEEVHAVAPQAGLAFCGPNTFVEYTSCLQQLIGAGATILVDDVIFPGLDLMSAANPDTQAVETLLTENPSVALFTAAGNYNGSYWEGPYAPVSLASQSLATLTCPLPGGTQTDAYVAEFGNSPSEQLTVNSAGTFPLMFAWADPFDANMSQFDVYWSNNADPTQSGCFSTAGVNGNLITPNLGLAAGSYTIYVATPDASAAGKFLKFWVGGDGLTFLSTASPGGIVSAQAYAAGAITIGAVDGSDGSGNQIETFSSLGPLTLEFPTPSKVQAPILVAPDGIYVDAAGTYFESLLFPDGNFYGTSASVPNAGAVAALLRGAFPELTVPQLVQTLTSSAAQLGGSVPDDTYGYGRVDAMGALATFPAPTITALPDSTIEAGASTPPLAFSVTGTGTLRFRVTSSNASLVPATLAASAPGVSIAPSGCGASVSSCTATVTAAAGAGGTTSVTLYAVDGANRSAAAPMTITVEGPPPSASPPPPTASSENAPPSSGGGGAIGWLEIATLTLLTLIAAARATLGPTRREPRELARRPRLIDLNRALPCD